MSWFFPIFFRTFSNHDFTPNHAVESILVEVTNEFYVDKFKGQFSFLILIHQQHLILRINISFLKHFLHLALRMPHSPSFLLISLAIPSQSPLLVIPPKLLRFCTSELSLNLVSLQHSTPLEFSASFIILRYHLYANYSCIYISSPYTQIPDLYTTVYLISLLRSLIGIFNLIYLKLNSQFFLKTSFIHVLPHLD